jgi:hypothetical protein
VFEAVTFEAATEESERHTPATRESGRREMKNCLSVVFEDLAMCIARKEEQPSNNRT